MQHVAMWTPAVICLSSHHSRGQGCRLKQSADDMHACCAQVKVFWPGMGKWYAGKVAAYDGRSAEHTILYKDGDVQRLTLRQEAVVWPDVPGLDGPGLVARLAGEADAAEVRTFPGSCHARVCSHRLTGLSLRESAITAWGS